MHRTNKLSRGWFFLSLLALLLPFRYTNAAPTAAPGDLDPTFGVGGQIITSFPNTNFSAISALVQQQDGKIVAAGAAGVVRDFALARYNGDGRLDPSFGAGGVVTTAIGVGASGASALTIQSDGKLVTAGVAANGSGDYAVVIRYNPNGTLDPTFGNGGKSSSFDWYSTEAISSPARHPHNKVPNPRFEAYASAVAMQSDGKIIVAENSSFALDHHAGVIRYNANGSLDLSFASNELPYSYFVILNALAIQPDGKIVTTGQVFVNGASHFVLIRYATDGSFDPSFGTNGVVITDFSGLVDAAQAVGLQRDGKIIVAGSTSPSPSPMEDFALARYNTDGSLDNTFGSEGKITTDFAGGDDQATALALQPNGRIAVAGRAGNDSSANFALALYNADGSLDSGFGSGGKVTIDFAGGADAASGLVVQGESKLIIAGTVTLNGQPDFGLARLATDSSCALPLSDVPQGSPFYPYVACLITRNIINGYSDCTYQPSAGVTRGQLAKFVANAAGYSDAVPRGQQTFTDVRPTDPFWVYIERAAAHGVISGYSNGDGTFSFRPSQPVTRGQAAKFVARAAGYREAIPATQQTFSDVPPADPFWLYIERVKAHGVIGGYADGTFHPRDAVTRGQTAKFIANALVPNCQVPAP